MSNPYLPQPMPPSVHPTSSFAGGAPAPRRNGIAIAALVLSILALLGVVGIGVMGIGAMAAGAFMFPAEFLSEEYTLAGTAAQVVEGQPYPGDRLTIEVERVLENDWSTYEDIECNDTTVVKTGAVATCTGVVDDLDTDMTVEFEDELGHFTLVQHY